MDEIGIGALNHIAELHADGVRSYTLDTTQFGFSRVDAQAIIVDSPQASLDMIRSVLDGAAGPATDITLVNAGAAIHIGGGASNLSDGIESARESIRSGNAARALERLIAVSNASDR